MIEDSECTHPINLDSLCGVCGKDLQYISQNKKEIKNYHPLFHSTDSLKINDAVFRDLYTERMSKLLNEKKLILLVDLDQTILCTVSETGQILNKPISQNDDKNSPDKNSLDKNTIENFDSLDKNTIKNFDSPDKNTIENFDSLDKNTIENFDSLDKNTIKNFDSLDKNTIKNFDSSKTFESPENQSKEKENKIHYTIDGQHFITYLRSGLKDFLFKLSLLFECHIYTAGTKSYTDALFKKIPYFKEVFSDRIITRETGHSDNQEIKNTTEDENLEDLGVFLPSQSQFQNSNILLKKSLSRLFGPFSHHVLIIDDRADIWAYIDNLIMIRPYYYKNDCNSDEKTLDCVYEQLEQVHGEFFSKYLQESKKKESEDQKSEYEKTEDKESKDQKSEDESDNQWQEELEKDLFTRENTASSDLDEQNIRKTTEEVENKKIEVFKRLDHLIESPEPLNLQEAKRVRKNDSDLQISITNIMRNSNFKILSGNRFYFSKNFINDDLQKTIEMHGGRMISSNNLKGTIEENAIELTQSNIGKIYQCIWERQPFSNNL